MKTRLSRLQLGIQIASVCLLLAFIFIPANHTSASAEDVKWSRVNIPTEGKPGNWVLANGSDIQLPTISADGTIYAYGKGLTYTLYKSTDGGHSWTYTGNVQDSIVAIATAPSDPNTVYYATTANVYRSTDGGKSFRQLPAPGGAGSNNIEITSLTLTHLNNPIIAVGTRDTDNAQFGGVYTIDTEMPLSWTNTNLIGFDVYALAFSPNYPADRQIVAVATDETNTFVTTKIASAAWGATIGNARLNKDNSPVPSPLVVANSAAIAFPSNYDGTSATYAQFVAVDTGTGNGDVYRIESAPAPGNSAAIDLNIGSAYGLSNVDITGLAASGNGAGAYLLAGAAASAQTYSSSDGGRNWSKSRKEPTGSSRTYVLMAPDFPKTGKAYAATSGNESAFSISQDSGALWTQIGFVDTAVSAIIDLAPSPDYSKDNTLFMLTFGDSEHSLWRSLDGGTSWERVLNSVLPNVDTIDLVKLSPQYGTSRVVFLAGNSNSRPVIWKSTDGGQIFNSRMTFDPTTGASFNVDTWVVVSDTTLFIGSYDGAHGLVYRTTDSGLSYSSSAEAGSQSLNSIMLSPDFEQDKTILVGNTNGWVYQSEDNGVSFESVPGDASSPPLTGAITAAFDPNFSKNRIVYAASSTAGQGVFRFTIGTSSNWSGIDSTLPAGSLINQLMMGADGTLYAANAKANSGIERSLNPEYTLGPTFETVTRGLSDGATFSGLWRRDQRLWSADTANNRLMTFVDSLTSPPALTSPQKAGGLGTLINHNVNNVSLDWKAIEDATSYQWQLNYISDFSSVPAGFEGTTNASSVSLPTLQPGTTYYWRVRVSAPILSPWSDKGSFTTSLDTEPVALKLASPEAGAAGIPVKPVFQWSAVAGASAYEVLIGTDVNLASPSISKVGQYALATTAWQSDVSLNYNTTYYWKVRAISASTYSDWSAASAFTTEAAPPAPPPAPPLPAPKPEMPTVAIVPITPITPLVPATVPSSISPPPSPVSPAPPVPPLLTQTTPGWVIYLIGGLLLIIVLLLVIILTLIIRTTRD